LRLYNNGVSRRMFVRIGKGLSEGRLEENA
jgi:hypothetical protein